MRPGTGDGLAARTGGGLAACTSSTCSRNCLVSSCRFSLMKCLRHFALRPRASLQCSRRNDDRLASTRSCFESLLVVPYLPQVIWETGWCRAVLPMPREQLFSPRLPNQGDVPLTQARVGALFLKHTDGAPILVRARSVPKPAVRIAAYAPGC